MKYIVGDITEQTEGIIMHGCNAKGVMGSGVALSIRKKWPVVYDEYSKLQLGPESLGSIQTVKINDNLWVINAITQNDYGKDGRVYADMSAIRTSFMGALSIAEELGGTLKLPKIGCGLGGLDWDNHVKPILELCMLTAEDVNVEIYSIE